MIKEKNEEKRKKNWKCPFSLNNDKKSALRKIMCNGCGTIFKSKYNTNYCLECKEIFYDEP